MSGFSYEYMSGNDHYRIADANNNRIATCYQEENAALVTAALNSISAANEQIRKLAAERTALERERLVSDKLVAALQEAVDGMGGSYAIWSKTARAALAEASNIRNSDELPLRANIAAIRKG